MRKKARMLKCKAAETVNAVVFFRELRGGLHGRLKYDNRKLCKNRNTRRQQERNLFLHKGQNLLFCGLSKTVKVENGQFNKFIMVIKVKSKVK